MKISLHILYHEQPDSFISMGTNWKLRIRKLNGVILGNDFGDVQLSYKESSASSTKAMSFEQV